MQFDTEIDRLVHAVFGGHVAELFAAEQVHVEVVDGLAGLRTGVDDESVAGKVDVAVGGYSTCCTEQVTEDGFVFRVSIVH